MDENELRNSIAVNDKILSGCNSHTSILGTSAAVLGTSYTYYLPASPFVIVEGPRIQPLLDFLDEVNKNK